MQKLVHFFSKMEQKSNRISFHLGLLPLSWNRDWHYWIRQQYMVETSGGTIIRCIDSIPISWLPIRLSPILTRDSAIIDFTLAIIDSQMKIIDNRNFNHQHQSERDKQNKVIYCRNLHDSTDQIKLYMFIISQSTSDNILGAS